MVLGMTRILALLVPVVLVLASCSKHPLHGGWREEGASSPRVFEFDVGSDELMVHTPPRADGGHDHLHGKYLLDGAKITVEWQEGGAQRRFAGKLDGDRIELSSGADKLALVRGVAAH